jgi:citrate lyase beta subunit
MRCIFMIGTSNFYRAMNGRDNTRRTWWQSIRWSPLSSHGDLCYTEQAPYQQHDGVRENLELDKPTYRFACTGTVVLRCVLALILVTTCFGLSSQTAHGQYQPAPFKTSKGEVTRGGRAHVIRSVDVPGLVWPGVADDTFIADLNKAAAFGANSVCFDLSGFSEDGSALSEDDLATLYAAQHQIEWRYMGPIIRVLGSDAPKTAEARLTAVQTAAKAFRKRKTAMYLIDGPDSAALAEAFTKGAPKLLVIAAGAGDLQLAESGSAEGAILTTLDKGKGTVDLARHYLLADKASTYEAYEEALTHPLETSAWMPSAAVLSEAEQAEGFVALFDGKSFDGWIVEGKADHWRIHDGSIEWVRRGGGVVRSTRRYDDFVLRFSFVIGKGENSGLFLRAPRANRSSKIGMEFQILGDYGKEPSMDCTGAIYTAYAPTVNASKKAGEWNDVEITLRGSYIRTVLNGVTVVEVNMETVPELRHRIRDGFLGLQDHGGYVAFRDIRIKTL